MLLKYCYFPVMWDVADDVCSDSQNELIFILFQLIV